ncbi:MAG: electron transfer flavoprotein subunit beta/FixA family protein [Actinomycetes bacterium]
MKIAVCVKAVPDAFGRRIDPATFRLDRTGDLSLSEYDAHPVEEALRLRESNGGEVIVVSLGPERAADALRKTLAMGADRSVLVSDGAFAGADLLATAHALAGALRRETADLILFGQQSADGDGACLWAAVAESLRLPVISQVSEITVVDGGLVGRRQTEFGYERIRVPLPAVVAVSDAINEPRYPSLKGIMGAKAKPQEVIGADDVGGEGASGTSVLSVSTPPARARGRRIEGTSDPAQDIVDYLVKERLL